MDVEKDSMLLKERAAVAAMKRMAQRDEWLAVAKGEKSDVMPLLIWGVVIASSVALQGRFYLDEPYRLPILCGVSAVSIVAGRLFRRIDAIVKLLEIDRLLGKRTLLDPDQRKEGK